MEGALALALARLRANKFDQDASFSFNETVDDQQQPPNRWTMEQALAVSEALMASNGGLDSLEMDLAVCRPEAIGLFLNFIGSSKSLRTLKIDYNQDFRGVCDSEELIQSYQSEIDNLFHAVLKNPAIQNLSLSTQLLGSPHSICEVLSKVSLRYFALGGNPSHDVALQTAVGLSRNTSLTTVSLGFHNAKRNLGIIISGLGRHPSLKDLSIWYGPPDADIFAAISRLLHFTPSLEKLKIKESNDFKSAFSCDVNFGKVLMDLYQPSLGQQVTGAGLRELKLDNVCIGLGWEKIQEQMPPVLINKVNNVLETLTLDGVFFFGRNAVKLLWPFVGLRTLKIENIEYGNEYEEDNDEDISSVWKELLERNPKLQSVSTRYVNEACFTGVIEGAYSLENLESLVHREWMYEQGREIADSSGTLLRRLLQKTTSIKQFSMYDVSLTETGADQLACGISSNKSIRSLVLHMCGRQPDTTATTVAKIIGSLIVNNKIESLDLRSRFTRTIPINGDVGRSLSAMLRVNTALLHLHCPCLVFRGTVMGECLGALTNKSRLKTLNLVNCDVDSECLVALGRVLERENIALCNVHLPPLITDEAARESLKTFVASLMRVPRRLAVTFQDSSRELLELLLQAAKENKNIVDFGISGAPENRHSDISAKINFNLKLNRFGRALFGSTSMPRNLWPEVLALMASDKDGPDALFYSLCQYFTSFKPGQGPQEAPQGERPSKRVRI